MSPDERSIAGVPTSVAVFAGYFEAGPIGQASRVRSAAEFERGFGGLSRVSLASYAVRQFFLNGGRDAWVVRTASGDAAPGVPGLPGAPDLIDALAALDTIDLFNVLCLPDTERLGDADAARVIAAATTRAVARRAMYVVDLPQRDAARDQAGPVEMWLQAHPGLRSPNAALYCPRPEIADPLDRDQPRAVPASGTMAGLYARVDAGRGVWKAPAGREWTLHAVTGLERTLTDAQHQRLAGLGVNTLRWFPDAGTVCWGARTLAGDDAQGNAWKYLPVRRLALFIEESVLRGTRPQAGDVNGEPLWAGIRLRAGTFLHGLFVGGAFQGLTPREAFFVKCDGDTTSAGDIADGVVNIVVGFAPLKPAEFVILRLQQPFHRTPDPDRAGGHDSR